MRQIVNVCVPVPEEILLSLSIESDELASQMALMTAIKLYESRKISVGQAAAFACTDEVDFIRFLGQHRVSIFGTGSEIAEDFVNA